MYKMAPCMQKNGTCNLQLTSKHYLYMFCSPTDEGQSGSVRVIVLKATFNNISVVLWRSVLLEGETGVPGENH